MKIVSCDILDDAAAGLRGIERLIGAGEELARVDRGGLGWQDRASALIFERQLRDRLDAFRWLLVVNASNREKVDAWQVTR